jgi:tetratricopeptide (TPR) repeat protein
VASQATPGKDPPVTGDGRRDPHLVGREREMADLRDALEAAVAGHGPLVLISGDPAIGKSHLVDRFATEARASGARVLVGRCWEAGGAPPYWPWVQALRGHLRDAPGPAIASSVGRLGPELARILPELRDLLPDLAILPDVDREPSRFAIFDALAAYLRAIASDQPLVLVLEDLHAADEPSIRLLQFVAADLPSSQLLLVGTYREGRVAGDATIDLLSELSRQPGTRWLRISGLSQMEVARYIEATSGALPDVRLADAVFQRTDGNPLFVGEVVRLLGNTRRLDDPTTVVGGIALPRTVRDVIGRRLGLLTPRCRAVLSRGAVVGTDLPVDLLASVEGVPPDELIEVLDEAVRAGVLMAPLGLGGRWRFAHALFQEVLYASLPGATRIALHRRVGEALESLHADDPDPHLAELAHHFLAADGGEKAVDYASRAATRSMSQSAYEEAARLYRLALDVGDVGGIDRCRLLLALGAAAMRAGDQALMRASFLDAAELADRLGASEELAQAAVGYGGQLVHRRAGDDSRLIPLLERGLKALPAGGTALRARLLARLAGALRDQPDPARRIALSGEAVEIARRLDDPVTLGYALQSRHAAIWGPDALEEMTDLLDASRAIALAAGDRERLAENHWARAVVLTNIGADAAVFRAEVDAGTRLADELRQPALRWFGTQWRAAIALNDGRLDAAEALLAEVRETGDRTVPWDADYAFRIGIALVRREQDRLSEVAADVRRGIADFPGYRLVSCLSAYVDAATGNEPGAAAALERILRDHAAFLPKDLGWTFGMVFLAETALVLEAHDAAREIGAILRPYAGQFSTASGVFPGGPVDRVLGLLAADAGDLDQALADLDRAARASERTGARLWSTRIAVDRAAVLIRRASTEDPASARTLLDEAQATALSLGLAAIQRRAEAILEGLGPREPAGPGLGGGDAVFRREGDYWLVGLRRPVRLRHALGLAYLARLVASPGQEAHALDLLGGVAGSRPTTTPRVGPSIDVTGADRGGGIAAIDAEARAAYRARIRELQAELDEAESFNDPARAERARVEIDALEAELAAAFGLGGRSRAVGSPAERARQSVTKAIKEAIRRISKDDPALGAHFQRSVHTGLYCIYDPDPSAIPRWHV